MITLTLTWLAFTTFTFQLVSYRKRSWSLSDIYNLHTQSYFSCFYFTARINYAAPLAEKTTTIVEEGINAGRKCVEGEQKVRQGAMTTGKVQQEKTCQLLFSPRTK